MSDRIRQLEDALAILQSTVSGPSGEPHPLLHRDLLKIKSSIELHSASTLPGGDEHLDREEEDEGEKEECIDAFGTLAIRDDGAATFYGRSAGSEVGFVTNQTIPSTDLTRHKNPLTFWLFCRHNLIVLSIFCSCSPFSLSVLLSHGFCSLSDTIAGRIFTTVLSCRTFFTPSLCVHIFIFLRRPTNPSTSGQWIPPTLRGILTSCK